MFLAAARAGGSGHTLRATKSIAANVTKTAFPTQIESEVAKVVVLQNFENLNCFQHNSCVSSPRVTCGISGAQQFRYAHTDNIKIPDFDAFRKQSSKTPYRDAGHGEDETNIMRKNFTYVLGAGLMFPGAVLAKNLVRELVSSMSISKDVMALSKTEIELNSIPEGKTVVMIWRSKPLFVRHRTAEEIEAEATVNVNELRDKEHDHERCQKPEWLIVLGVCTHLGCVPITNAGSYGGFFCPCHGSHYDTSGRIRKGPAPLNLEVPPYSFPSDDLCVVG